MLPSRPLRRSPRRLRLIVPAALAVATLAVPTAAFAATPTFVIAVLGDSYASGEGSPDVHGHHEFGPGACDSTPPACVSEKWWSPDSWFAGRDAVFPQGDDPGWQAAARRCHRSTRAPGPHAAMLLADQFPDVRVEVLDFACGGSEIGPGLVNGWSGPEPPSGAAANLPAQITALRDYADQTGREIDATVVNIGGNDGGFAKIVQECLDIPIVIPLADCSGSPTLDRIREQLIPDADSPTFPDPDAPLNQRYRRLNTAVEAPANAAGRPDELYLTALPNPAHDAPPATIAGNPQDFCDGSQTTDRFYKNANRSESVAIEDIVRGLNLSMGRAAARHGWTFLPQMFDAWRNHGVCADSASFFRTSGDALKIQGPEGGPLPPLGMVALGLSPGIAHPNEAGYADRARQLAAVLRPHMQMRFRAPVVQIDNVEANQAFRVSWADPSPAHLAETRWEMRLASPTAVTHLSSNSPPGELGFSTLTSGRLTWRVPATGDFQVRVRGCRTTRNDGPDYCGPYSDTLSVATSVPTTPLQLRRRGLLPLDLFGGPLRVRLTWIAAPDTPASAWYDVKYEEHQLCLPAAPGTCFTGGGVVTASTATAPIDLPHTGLWSFRVRACTAAGCSPFSARHFETVDGH